MVGRDDTVLILRRGKPGNKNQGRKRREKEDPSEFVIKEDTTATKTRAGQDDVDEDALATLGESEMNERNNE